MVDYSRTFLEHPDFVVAGAHHRAVMNKVFRKVAPELCKEGYRFIWNCPTGYLAEKTKACENCGLQLKILEGRGLNGKIIDGVVSIFGKPVSKS